jgi:hypothetical protein
LPLVFSAALPVGLAAGFELILVSDLLSVLVPAVLFFVLSAVLFDLVSAFVLPLASVLAGVVAVGRELGTGTALVLVDVCAEAQVNAPHARMPQAASRTVSRISRTWPPAANT